MLSRVSVEAANVRPELFFETWRDEGGTATINHPFLTALPHAPIAELHYDLSWRDLRGEPVHPGMTEIFWLSRHANAIETWNESVGHVRDRYFVGDPDWEMRQASHLVDRLGREEERRVASVGGSDSHGSWLRPTTWVLAKDRTPAAIRDAIVNARTCARAPEPCTLEARGVGEWATVGSSIASANRKVVTYCEEYRHAVEDKDVGRLITMASPRYYEDGGNTSPDDDVDFDGLKDYLQSTFVKTQTIRYEIRYRKVSVSENKRVFVEYTYTASYRIPGLKGEEWKHTVADNRLELVPEGESYKILAGM